jgi:hypothetical protein
MKTRGVGIGQNHMNVETFANAHPSRLFLGRYLTGDLDAKLETEVQAHVLACPQCSRRVQEARLGAADFLALYPDRQALARAHDNRRAQAGPARSAAPARMPFWSRWLRVVPQFAMATLVLGLGAIYWAMNARAVSDLTPKGDSRFYLFVNGIQAAQDTIACGPQDTLQLGLTSPGPMHYAVLYRDDQSGIQVYMAGEGTRPLGNPKGENLPHSLILQGDWRHEVLYCIWSPKPFSLEDAKALAADPRPAEAPDSLRLQTYLLVNQRL